MTHAAPRSARAHAALVSAACLLQSRLRIPPGVLVLVCCRSSSAHAAPFHPSLAVEAVDPATGQACQGTRIPTMTTADIQKASLSCNKFAGAHDFGVAAAAGK